MANEFQGTLFIVQDGKPIAIGRCLQVEIKFPELLPKECDLEKRFNDGKTYQYFPSGYASSGGVDNVESND